MNFKKIMTVIILFLLVRCTFSQKGYYAGIEGVYKLDNFVYASESNQNFHRMAIGLLGSIYAGKKYEYFSAEIAFSRHMISPPDSEYDYAMHTVSPGTRGSGGSIGNSMLCLRVGHDFRHRSRRYFLKPDVGLLLSLVDEYYLSSWVELKDQTTKDDDTYTEYSRFIPSRLSFGIESALTAGYCIRNKCDIYLKVLLHSYFQSPCMFSVQHFSGSFTEKAIINHNGVSTALQIGIRYYFGKQFQT